MKRKRARTPSRTDLFRLLAEKGYDAYLSYEARNPAYWQQFAIDVAKQGAARHLLANAFP
ncbi:MAG TPA: hypothetical protein VKY24_14470 [Reyranella sp.]|nr:hypothetical protein [Reyranella sp.]